MYNQRQNNHHKHMEQPIQRKPITLKQQSDHSFQENIKIYLRLKPQLQVPHGSECIKIINTKEVQIIPGSFASQADRVFTYQEVFEPSATNFQVFNTAILDPIANVLSGFNSTVFIYGMTGAGKTFTMFNSSQQGQDHQGIVDSTLVKLFEDIQADRANQYEVRLSFFEIYNQNIRDLLSQNREPLILLEDPLQGVIINQLKEISVDNEKDARQCIQEGMNRRVRQATKNNQSSSRSHALLQFTVRKITLLHDNQYSLQESKLFMIDLAGNQKASQNQSKRFIEGVNINKSLLTLGKCISVLSQKKKNAFIPYRDSKLTRILKDSLGGNSKTVMIACVSTQSRFYEETLNTLKYSSKAKQIKNKGNGGLLRKVKINEPPIIADEQSRVTLQQEEKIFSFVNSMESILTEKIKTQSVQEQLELCLHDSQVQRRLSPLKLKQVRNTLGKIREKYKHILLSLQEQINVFVTVIRSLKTSKYSCERENEALKKEISKQKELILQLQKRDSQGPHLKSGLQCEFKSENGFSVVPVCLSQPEVNESHQASIHEKFQKNQLKKNPISIKIESCRNSNKENVPFNSLKRSHTSHSSTKFEKVTTESKKMAKARSKPVIDITKQNFKLQSPSIKEPILIRSDSNDSNALGFGFNAEGRLQQFVRRLKEIDRNSSTVDLSTIAHLLQEFERQGYQVGRLEKSMLSKLRFMIKNKPKIDKRQTIAVRSVQI